MNLGGWVRPCPLSSGCHGASPAAHPFGPSAAPPRGPVL